ncbi:MAG: GEVED domain-containing protein, partial [Bacteroidota bacterium]
AWQVTAYTKNGEQLAPPSSPFWFQVADESQTEVPVTLSIVDGPHVKESLAPDEDLVFKWRVSGQLTEPATYLFQVYQYDLTSYPRKFSKENLVFSKSELKETQLIIPRKEVQWNPEKGYVWLVYLLTKEHYFLQDSIFPITFPDKRFDFGDAPDDPVTPAGYRTLLRHDGARCYWMMKGNYVIDQDVLPNPGSDISLFRTAFGPICVYDRYIPETQQAWLGTIENRYLCDEIKPDLESDSRSISAGEDNFDDGIFFTPTVDYCDQCRLYSIDVEMSIHQEYIRSNKLLFTGWVDWNADGDWDDDYEDCLGSDKLSWTRVDPLYNTSTAPLLSGNVAWIDPETWGGDTTCAGYRFYFYSGKAPDVTADRPARFRLTPNLDGDIPQGNSTSYWGEVTSGEVEDYIIPCFNYGYRLKVISPKDKAITTLQPEFSVILVPVDENDTEKQGLSQYERWKSLGGFMDAGAGADTSCITLKITIYDDPPREYVEAVRLHPGKESLTIRPVFDPPLLPDHLYLYSVVWICKPGYGCIALQNDDGPYFRTSFSGEPHSVRSCEGEWNRTIVSSTDILVDSDHDRLCTMRDAHAVLVDRPGCPLTPEGAEWIGENESGISASPHEFIHCFNVDGCIRNACIEIISPARYNIYLNGHVIGSHNGSCASLSSFTIPYTYFDPGGNNMLLFNYSTSPSSGYYGFAFALHIQREDGAYETNLPVITLTNPITSGPLYLCDMTGLICRSAPCLSYPLVPEESIQFRITDDTRILTVQLILSYQTVPSATTDCRHFSPTSSGYSGLLEVVTHFSTTPVSERELLVTIPVTTLTGFFPGLSGDCMVNVTCIVTDGACVQNTLQTAILIKLGCE